MPRTTTEYAKLLMSLRPKGKFWTKSLDSIMFQVLMGIADGLSRIEGRSEDLVLEAFTATITELLEEWEEDFGIPEKDFDLAPDVEGRREDINTKLIAVGQQDKGYFIDIASALGWTVTITEFEKSLAGIMTAGESIVTDERCVFYWMVDVWVEDPNNADIEKLAYEITLRKPGHSIVLFRFYDVGFSNGFDNGFSAVPWWDGGKYWWPLGFDRGFSNGFSNDADYYGFRLAGGFTNGFAEGFHCKYGGGFGFESFSNGFDRPS